MCKFYIYKFTYKDHHEIKNYQTNLRQGRGKRRSSGRGSQTFQQALLAMGRDPKLAAMPVSTSVRMAILVDFA